MIVGSTGLMGYPMYGIPRNRSMSMMLLDNRKFAF